MKERIKQLRKRERMTQAELAFVCGYKSKSIVTLWESGARKPSVDKLPVLAKTLRTTIGYLVTGDPRS